MQHPSVLHLTHQCYKTGAYLIPCFGCGSVFPYSGNICNSPGCLETWNQKVAEYNGQAGAPSEVPMPPLDPPAGDGDNVIELPEGSKANFNLED